MAFDGNNLAIGAEDANEGIDVVYIFDVETGMESHRLTVDDSAIGEIGEVVDFDNGIVISSSNADTAFVFDAKW